MFQPQFQSFSIGAYFRTISFQWLLYYSCILCKCTVADDICSTLVGIPTLYIRTDSDCEQTLVGRGSKGRIGVVRCTSKLSNICVRIVFRLGGSRFSSALLKLPLTPNPPHLRPSRHPQFPIPYQVGSHILTIVENIR